MSDWFRSFAALSVSFVAVVVATVGISVAVRPHAAGTGENAAASDAPPSEDTLPRLGGSLAVTGDRQGTFTLTREAVETRYSLVGDDGRITFDGNPLTVAQVSYDGLEFFPEPGACSLEAGEFNSAAGVAATDLGCGALADVRGNGVITLQGTVGLPADLLGIRGDLPPAGGSVEVGGETWDFPQALLLAWRLSGGGDQYNLELVDEGRATALRFHYDHVTHELSLVRVERDADSSVVPPDACEFRERQLGRVNPRTTVVELTMSCSSVEVPGLGAVPIAGTVIVEEIEFAP